MPAASAEGMPATSDEIGTTEQDWTRLPADDASIREPREPEVILAALAATPVELGRMLDEASPEALVQPSHDGGAAVVEVVAHLRDWEGVAGDWIARMLADDAPPVLPVPDDSLWAIEHDYASEDPHRAFADFRDRRAALLVQIGALDVDGWGRSGTLDRDGTRTVQQVLDVLADQDAGHLERAREALA
ncbi:MAG: DinB family protein [Thermomicrobiales bacterium]